MNGSRKSKTSRTRNTPETRPVRFEYTAPKAGAVAIAGSFNDWRPHAMEQEVSGIWFAELQLGPGRYEYRFIIDGRWVEDPQALEQAINPYGSANSVRLVG